MRLRPFFSYYGSKWRIINHYPPPIHDKIIEPFCGSANYALRYPKKNILINDLDENIFIIWNYLINVSVVEIEKLPIIKYNDNLDNFSICQEAKLLIGFWINKATTYPCKKPSAWMKNPLPGRTETFWGEAIKKRIIRQLPYIRHWKISNKSYEELDNEVATWFIDPPYPDGGHKYRYNKINYLKLQNWYKQRKGQWIYCTNGNNNDLLIKGTSKMSKEKILTNINLQQKLF